MIFKSLFFKLVFFVKSMLREDKLRNDIGVCQAPNITADRVIIGRCMRTTYDGICVIHGEYIPKDS